MFNVQGQNRNSVNGMDLAQNDFVALMPVSAPDIQTDRPTIGTTALHAMLTCCKKMDTTFSEIHNGRLLSYY